MAVLNRTKIAILLLIVNIYCAKSDSETDADYTLDESKTDQILKDNGDVIEDTDVQNYERDENFDKHETNTESYTTTEAAEDKLKRDESKDKDLSSERGKDEPATEPATATDDTMSMTDFVYKPTDSDGDIYSTNNEGKIETTTRSMEVEIDKSQELDDLDVPGSRNPKTDRKEPHHPDLRTFEIKPRPDPVVSRSHTLKSWLEDSWLRPPAGLLVPLRPIALNRALAVWSDLMVEGLNVSDIVIVGYDSNGVNWRSRHNLQPNSNGGRERDVSEALSKLLLKYQGVNTDNTVDGTMRALTTAAKLVPYDSALFVITDKGAGDPQRLPLALRALVEKRLKVYTIWTDPNHMTVESEAALQELRNISRHTEGDVLPYSMPEEDVETSSNLASEVDLKHWAPLELKPARRGRVYTEHEFERFDTLLVRRGGAEAISVGLPIEGGITALKILIEGAVEHAVFYPPNEVPNPAPQIDLYNTSSVAAFSAASRTEGLNPREVYLIFPGAELDVDTLSVIPANPVKSEAQAALVGAWHLSIRCDTCDYRLAVSARSLIHLDVEPESTETLRIRVTGPVASVRESLLVDEYGNEVAKLSFSYQPITAEGQSIQVDDTSELVADVSVPVYKGSKVYVKIVGRDVQGESFVRLSVPLNQPEVRHGRSAPVKFPEPTDLELAEEENARVYSRLQYNDSNVLPFGRAVSQVVNQVGTILTSVQIGLSTRLYGSPGDSIQLHFEVSNFRDQSVSFRFGAVGELRFLTGINPASQTIPSGQTVNVIVSATITASAQPGARDFITFTAYGLDQVSISAYVYVVNPGTAATDVWAPEIRHNFQGSCIGRQDMDCAQHVWSATIIARDALGGLLRLTSSPMGLIYDSNFISGTREEVVATYRATCCAPRVMVTAVDSYGNVNSYTVDISNYFTPAAIAAIVLGVLLAIALIILLVYLIIWCVKRRKESRELPYSTSSRNIS